MIRIAYALITLMISISLYAEVKVEKLSKTITSWDGMVLPVYPKGQPEVSILKYTIPPNTQLPTHFHPVINAAYIIKGKLTVIKKIDNSKIHLKEGDTLVELVNQLHYGINETDMPTELLVFYAGIKNTTLTILNDQ